jgi:hypothetical protein
VREGDIPEDLFAGVGLVGDLAAGMWDRLGVPRGRSTDRAWNFSATLWNCDPPVDVRMNLLFT